MRKAPAIPAGVNQRANVVMTPEEVQAYLHSQSQVAFCTLRSDGSIHAVAMAYGFLQDGRIAFEAKAKSQKIKNLLGNPTLTILCFDGEEYEELRGVQLSGKGQVSDDPDLLLECVKSVYERSFGPVENASPEELDQMVRGRVTVTIDIDRTVSWDHHKLLWADDGSK